MLACIAFPRQHAHFCVSNRLITAVLVLCVFFPPHFLSLLFQILWYLASFVVHTLAGSMSVLLRFLMHNEDMPSFLLLACGNGLCLVLTVPCLVARGSVRWKELRHSRIWIFLAVVVVVGAAECLHSISLFTIISCAFPLSLRFFASR